MTKIYDGLYEQLITYALAHQLQELDQTLSIERVALDPEEAPDRIALFLGRLVHRAKAGAVKSYPARTSEGGVPWCVCALPADMGDESSRYVP